MPSRSERQRRYLYMRFGKAWVHRHHFHVVKKRKTTQKKRKSARKKK